MKICVIAQDATFANAYGICEALKEYASVKAVFRQENWKNFESGTVDCAYGYEKIPENYDKYVVCGAGTFLDIEDYFEDQSKMLLIFSDSHYVFNKDYINNKTRNSHLFLMNDLVVHRGQLPYKIFYHPMQMPNVLSRKYPCVSACHSPGTQKKSVQKGTKIIRRAAVRARVPLRTVMGRKWKQTLEIKNKHKIFIDQVGDVRSGFNGGLGKSGLEGMLLGCLTMTNFTPVESDIPNPPVVNIDVSNIFQNMMYYKNNKSELRKVVDKQKEWAEKYTSYDFFARRVMELWRDGK